jgi:hypothetical protein
MHAFFFIEGMIFAVSFFPSLLYCGLVVGQPQVLLWSSLSAAGKRANRSQL